MASIFTKIIDGEIPCHRIMEDDNFLAFLDVRPIHEGHTLVIPKKEIDYIFNIDDDQLGEMIIFAKKVAVKIEKIIDCKRVGIMVAGLEVPHAHIHLVPITSVLDLNFANAKEADQSDLAKIAEKINSL